MTADTKKSPMRIRAILRWLAAALLVIALLLAAAALVFSWAVNRQVAAYEIYDYREIAPGAYLQVEGYDLHYQFSGDPQADLTGAPLMLVHGFASSSDEFGRLAPLLAGERSLILPDLLGFGYSQRLLQPDPALTHRSQAMWLKALLDRLGVAQIDLVGSSYGGAIAAQFALDYPERVRRIAFLDAQVYDEAASMAWVADLPLGLNRAMTWFALGGGPVARSIGELACYNPAACLGDGEFAARREAINRIKGNTDGLIAFSKTGREARVPADLGLLEAPALVIWGENDQIVPPENGQRLADTLGVPVQWIPQAGHIPHIERPELVAPLILDFFAQP